MRTIVPDKTGEIRKLLHNDFFSSNINLMGINFTVDLFIIIFSMSVPRGASEE